MDNRLSLLAVAAFSDKNVDFNNGDIGGNGDDDEDDHTLLPMTSNSVGMMYGIGLLMIIILGVCRY